MRADEIVDKQASRITENILKEVTERARREILTWYETSIKPAADFPDSIVEILRRGGLVRTFDLKRRDLSQSRHYDDDPPVFMTGWGHGYSDEIQLREFPRDKDGKYPSVRFTIIAEPIPDDDKKK